MNFDPGTRLTCDELKQKEAWNFPLMPGSVLYFTTPLVSVKAESHPGAECSYGDPSKGDSGGSSASPVNDARREEWGHDPARTTSRPCTSAECQLLTRIVDATQSRTRHRRRLHRRP